MSITTPSWRRDIEAGTLVRFIPRHTLPEYPPVLQRGGAR